jgi:hypothetical protein
MVPHARRALAALLVGACAGCAAPGPEEAVERPAPPPTAKPATAPTPAPAARSAPPPVAVVNAGERELALGIQNYDDGEYRVASRQLQNALDLGLDTKRHEAQAHKYLAFMVCVTGKEKACREHFRKALDADPGFELEPAEAGNPVWSAALRRAKAERARAERAKPKSK